MSRVLATTFLHDEALGARAQFSHASMLEIAVSIDTDGVRVLPAAEINEPLQRCVWVEWNNGILKVHVYDAAHEEPVSIQIFPGMLELNTEDMHNRS